MDENAPLTYLDLIYSSSNYVNYDNVSANYGSINAAGNIIVVPVNTSAGSQTEVHIDNSNNVTNNSLAYTSQHYDLSLWNSPPTIEYSPYRLSMDYGARDYGVGAVWRTNCNYDTHYTIRDCSISYGLYDYFKELNSTERKRREIKSNLTIIVKSRSQELRDIPDNEWVAMQTLREMITETAYRRYLKDGFISVYGQSGKVYQIFRNRNHQKVYLKGELIEEICVRLNGNVPPTDNVIAFKTMIEVDEESFAMLGNRYNMRKAA
jgi:hypothetical protein